MTYLHPNMHNTHTHHTHAPHTHTCKHASMYMYHSVEHPPPAQVHTLLCHHCLVFACLLSSHFRLLFKVQLGMRTQIQEPQATPAILLSVLAASGDELDRTKNSTSLMSCLRPHLSPPQPECTSTPPVWSRLLIMVVCQRRQGINWTHPERPQRSVQCQPPCFP